MFPDRLSEVLVFRIDAKRDAAVPGAGDRHLVGDMRGDRLDVAMAAAGDATHSSRKACVSLMDRHRFPFSFFWR